MDLDEQARTAWLLLARDLETPLDADPERLFKLGWLDGYRAGMEAIQTMAGEVFAKLQAELS